jgi:hypothetical protein
MPVARKIEARASEFLPCDQPWSPALVALPGLKPPLEIRGVNRCGPEPSFLGVLGDVVTSQPGRQEDRHASVPVLLLGVALIGHGKEYLTKLSTRDSPGHPTKVIDVQVRSSLLAPLA